MIFNMKKTFLNKVKFLKENLITKRRLEREDYLKMSLNDYKDMRDITILLPEKMIYANFGNYSLRDGKYTIKIEEFDNLSIEDLYNLIFYS